MRAVKWITLVALMTFGSPSSLLGGDHLKKLSPRNQACPPACPPYKIEQGNSDSETGSNQEGEQVEELGSQGSEAMDAGSSLPTDLPRRELTAPNTDRRRRGDYESLSSLGDFFAPDGQFASVDSSFSSYDQTLTNQPLSPGAGIGRFKTADSNSPIPRDRLFLDYSLFHNARLTSSDINVQRFVPGLESTFIDGLASLEIRLPIAVTLNSTSLGSSSDLDTNNTEFGNIAIGAKGILWSNDGFVLTTGIILQTPTADDLVFGNPNEPETVRIENKQYRLLPYLATLHHNDVWYWQNYMQLDLAANGNAVYVLGGSQDMEQIGVLQEQNYLYLDTSLSRWLYRNRRNQTGLAMTFELHYNTTINENDTISLSDARGDFDFGTQGFSADILNMVVGPTFLYGATTVSVAYGTPLTEDRGSDGELRVLLNRLF
jgi:hypothetical protein